MQKHRHLNVMVIENIQYDEVEVELYRERHTYVRLHVWSAVTNDTWYIINLQILQVSNGDFFMMESFWV